MKIGDLRTPASPLLMRHAAASPVQAAAPVDGVEISGGAASTDLVGAGGATAAAAAMTALAPRDLNRDEMKILVQTLERAGVHFQSRRKVLWFYTDFSPATPERVAKMVDKGKDDRIMARAHGLGWVGVKDQGDLRELEVFHGNGVPEGLPKPALARAVQDLHKAGTVFRSNADDYYSSNVVGPYGAYNVLAGDPHGWDAVHAHTAKGEKLLLKSEDEALALAFFEGVGGAQGLARPKQAESVRLLAMAGLSLPEKPLLQYRSLAESKPDKVLDVTYQKTVLAQLKVADLEDPVAVASRMQSLKLDYDALREAVGSNAVGAWKTMQSDGSKRPFAERLAAYTEIHKAVASPEPLYAELLASTPDGRPLNTRECLELARVFQRADGATVTKAWQEMRRLAADGKSGVSMAELKLRFTLLLAQTQDPVLAVGALDVLTSSGPAASYADREAAFMQFRGLPKGSPQVAFLALKALADQGGLPGDAARMAELLDDGSRKEAPDAYRHLKTLPSELQPSFARVFSRCDLEAAKSAFALIANAPPERVPARVEVWDGFLSNRDSWHRGETALQALGLLEEGPDFDRQAALMKRVLTFSGGQSLPEAWKKVLHHPAGEAYARLCEATGGLPAADQALSLLGRPELAAHGRPLAERAEALALLTSARDGDLAKGTDDFRFLAAWTPTDRSMADTASRLAALEKAAGPAEGRLALGAAETSPPGGRVGPTTYASLEGALKVGGTLADSRPIWEWLEKGGSAALLGTANKMAPTRIEARAAAVLQLAQVLTAAAPSADEQAALLKVSEDLSRELPAVQKFASEVVAGEGPCGPRVAAFGELAKALRNASAALECWPVIASEVGRPDFAERCAALAILQNGRDAKAAAALYPVLLESCRPGEPLPQVAGLLAALEPAGLATVRRWMDAGTVEGRPDPENTRFLADLLKGKTKLETLRKAWDAVARPVGRESTAERREAFLALHKDTLDASVTAWTDLVSWLPEGENLLEAARAYAGLGEALGKDGPEALRAIRTMQREGRLGAMKLPEAMERLLQFATKALAGRHKNLAALLKELQESVVIPDGRDIRQSEESVRIGTIELGRS